MNEMIEIRWHGRGGQGAETASQLLAAVVAVSGCVDKDRFRWTSRPPHPCATF